jgi:hypothetical protein
MQWHVNAIRKDDGSAESSCAEESQRSVGNGLSRADIEERRSRSRVSDSDWALSVFLGATQKFRNTPPHVTIIGGRRFQYHPAIALIVSCDTIRRPPIALAISTESSLTGVILKIVVIAVVLDLISYHPQQTTMSASDLQPSKLGTKEQFVISNLNHQKVS